MDARKLHQVQECSFIINPDDAETESDEDCPRPDHVMPPLDAEDPDYLDDVVDDGAADLAEDETFREMFNQASYILNFFKFKYLLLQPYIDNAILTVF